MYLSKNSFFILFVVLIIQNIYSQDSITNINKIPIKKTFSQLMDTLSIEKQFDLLYQSSDTYNNHKVVKFEWLQKLKTHTTDSISKLKTELTIKTEKLKEIEQNNAQLLAQLNDNQSIINQKNSISFLGIQIDKFLYQFLMWSMVAALAGFLAFYYHKFKQSHVVTRDALKRYEELEEEFRQARSRALEREQMLNRKLMDEMNKK